MIFIRLKTFMYANNKYKMIRHNINKVLKEFYRFQIS